MLYRMKKILKFVKTFPKKYLKMYTMIGLIIGLSYFVEFYLPLLQKQLIDFTITSKNIFNYYLYYLIFFYFIYFLLFLFSGIAIINLQVKLHKYFFKIFFQKITYLKKSTLLKNGVGYYYDILTKDVEILLQLTKTMIFDFVFSTFQTIGILILVFIWNKTIFSLFLFSYLLSILVALLFAKMRKKAFFKMRNISSNLADQTLDIFANNFAIKTFGTFDRFKKKIFGKYSELFKFVKHTLLIPELGSRIQDIIKTISFIVMLVFVLNLVILKKMSYGQLIALLAYFPLIFTPIINWQNILYLIDSVEISINRLESMNEKNLLGFKMKVIDKIYKLSFLGVGLFYDQKEILKSLSFDISHHKKVGLVGLSGEGKTSILKLLYKEATFNSGNIIINDQLKFDDISAYIYYSKVNVYSQNIEIFNNDLIFNLTLDKNVILIKDKERAIQHIEKIVAKGLTQISIIMNSTYRKNKQINKLYQIIKENDPLLDFFCFGNTLTKLQIAKNILNSTKFKILKAKNSHTIAIAYFSNNYVIEEKLKQIISELKIEKLKNRKFGTNGDNISGGEKQKIILGRFLLKEEYDFFILDEPFSSLDSITENALIKIMKKHIFKEKGIIISHKFNVLLNLVDDFMVIHNGEIVEKGSHRKLIEAKGTYKKIFDSYKIQLANK